MEKKKRPVYNPELELGIWGATVQKTRLRNWGFRVVVLIHRRGQPACGKNKDINGR